MKRKGLTILVAMLAVFFIASTVHAGSHSWWKYSVNQLWKKVSKIDKQTRWNTKKVKQLERKIHRKSKKWHKKKKKGSKGDTDMEALKELIIAELKADEAFMAALKGEKGDRGDPGEKGEDGESGTFLSHWESFTYYNHEVVDLSGVNLKGARILDTAFHDANLSGANLSKAHLDGSNFSSFNGVTNLAGANLKGASVVGTDFTGCDFSGADLTGVDLSTAFSVAGAMWTGATCPDGQSAEFHGGTCEGVSP
jgi:hypothetical protein